MLQIEKIEQLMADVGPVADLLAVDSYSSEGMWHIAIDEETEVFVEMAPSRGVLVVTGKVGKPTGGDLKALYELFLRYAHAWEGSEGLRMSLDAPDGALWLLFDCTGTPDMTAVDLGRLLTDFGSKLRAWREIVATHAQLPAEPQRLDALLNNPDLLRG